MSKLMREMEFLCYRPSTGSFTMFRKIVPKEHLVQVENQVCVSHDEFENTANCALMPRAGFYLVAVRPYVAGLIDERRPNFEDIESTLRYQGWNGND